AFIQFSDFPEPAAVIKNDEFSCCQTIKKLIGATCLEYRSRSVRNINSIRDIQYFFEPLLALIRKESNVVDLFCFRYSFDPVQLGAICHDQKPHWNLLGLARYRGVQEVFEVIGLACSAHISNHKAVFHIK